VVVEGDRLVLIGGSPSGADKPPANPPRYTLGLCGPDSVVCTDPPGAGGLRGTFGRDREGNIAWVRFGLRIYNRLPD
jgi:hypothetical protein